ncbi:hypothetical protein [Rubellimicrobium roseum]|uniref:HIRAN domain-containing protein n=1 Tax=Rubellimicrobium roseum TaxID=687525 RepID=A0A5C4NI97_9RHOB|nr:hypothetical protein [Rubellimicrobium roseum]TNC72149.1 hypothetical protein FHG71_08820 [Rubellimicrobium roseum]
METIEAVFLHCGVPLPQTLRLIYRRTLGVGNPVSFLPVLAAPFLRAVLPDEGFGSPVVGIERFETDLGLYRDEMASERPPILPLGHAAPLGLTAIRNGLWSLQDYQGRREPPATQDFGLVFEAAFCIYVDQVLLVWANDLAGDPVRRGNLDVTRGASLAAMPAAVRDAMAELLAPRTLTPRIWGDLRALDGGDLLRTRPRSGDSSKTTSLNAQVTVVGLPYGPHPEMAGRIEPGTRLRLQPVDDNPHDPKAVEVWYDGPTVTRLGFVARAEAPGVRDLPDGATAWRLRVLGRVGNVFHAALERRRPENETAPVGAGQDGKLSDPVGDLFPRDA